MSNIEIPSLLFDSAWYLETYKDVAKADANPIEHYLTFGYKEGRNPNRYFNTNFYLQTNPDVLFSSMNPFIHYILYGAKEGRLPRPINHSPILNIVTTQKNSKESNAELSENIKLSGNIDLPAFEESIKENNPPRNVKPLTENKSTEDDESSIDIKFSNSENEIDLIANKKKLSSDQKTKRTVKPKQPKPKKNNTTTAKKKTIKKEASSTNITPKKRRTSSRTQRSMANGKSKEDHTLKITF